MAEVVKIFALGGLDETGKSMYVVEAGNDIFIIESGLKYPDSTNPGIDMIIPNYDYLKANKHRVRAFIITHGHDDQMGALPWVYRDIQAPIYATNATIMMIKAFTKTMNMDVNYQFVPIEPSSDHIIAGREFNFFQTAHSMLMTFGFAMETGQGYVVYSGDFIVEYNVSANYKHDLNALGKIAEKPVLCLLSESLGAEKPGYTSPDHRLTPHINKVFQEARGRIFVATYNQSTYNIEEIIDLAKKLNKKILFYNDEVKDFFARFNSIGALTIPNNNFVSSDNLLRTREQDLIVLMMGHGENLYQDIELLASNAQEDKRFVLGPSDTFIVAAPPVPSIEILATDAIDQLYRTGAKVIHLTKKHIANMHAQEEDLKMLLSMLKPKYYIPIKGEYRHLMANAKLAVGMGVNLSHRNIFLLDNGMIVRFEDNGAKLLGSDLDRIPTSDLLIDGLGVGDISSSVIEDRQKLSDDGVIVLACAISKKLRTIVAGPDIQMRGFVFVKDSDNVLKELTNILVSTTMSYLAQPTINLEEAKDNIYEKALRYVRRETRKTPMILPLISEVD